MHACFRARGAQWGGSVAHTPRKPRILKELAHMKRYADAHDVFKSGTSMPLKQSVTQIMR